MHLMADGGERALPPGAAETCHPWQGEEEGKTSPLALSGFNSLLNSSVTLQTPDCLSHAPLLQLQVPPACTGTSSCCVRIPAQFKEGETGQHHPAAPSFIPL